MPQSLRELQTRVMSALLDDPGAAALGLIAAAPAQAAARLAVYRRTIAANFRASLSASFPVIERLVGRAYFTTVVARFHAVQPSTAGDLAAAGAAFPAYLAAVHAGGEHSYLGDVARFEWLCQAATTAPASVAGDCDFTGLAHVAAADCDTLHFLPHPALQLFESRFPVWRIWSANSDRESEPPLIALDGGADRLAIVRPGLELEFQSLEAGDYALLAAVVDGRNFSQAIAAACAADADFDAAAALRRCIEHHWIVAWRRAAGGA